MCECGVSNVSLNAAGMLEDLLIGALWDSIGTSLWRDVLINLSRKQHCVFEERLKLGFRVADQPHLNTSCKISTPHRMTDIQQVQGVIIKGSD